MNPDYTNYTDKELLSQMKNGDEGAFTEVYNRYWSVLWRYASQSMRDQDDAQDIVQDVFGTLWDKRHSVHIEVSVKAYLYRATLNRVIDRSNQTRFADRYLADLKATFEEGNFTTDNQIHHKELVEKFEAGLREMPGRMREIFEISRLEQHSHQEISERLGISRENVNRQIKNALIRLKKRLLYIWFPFFEKKISFFLP